MFLGSGSLWPAYCGVVENLIVRGEASELETVVGVSAGSLVGALFLASLSRMGKRETLAYLRGMVRTIDTRHLFVAPVGSEAVDQAVEFGYGMHSAVQYCNLVRSELHQLLGNPDATLLDIHRESGVLFRVLVYESPGHSMAGAQPLALDARTHPHLPVWVATRASSAVFPIVCPVRLRGADRWWVDPAIFKGNELWARSLVADEPGRHLVVYANGLRSMSLWQLNRGIWAFSEWEILFSWLVTSWVGTKPDGYTSLRGDPHVLRVDIGSFCLNLGYNRTLSNVEMQRAGRVACRRLMRALRRLGRPVEAPEEARRALFIGVN